MSVLSKLASMQDRRDEEPNKALARELVRTNDGKGIQEIAENLWHEDPKIQSDCDAVLEEIGRLDPALIENYVFDFLKLLSNRRNRRVWQAMMCLSLIADRKPREIFDNRESIIQAMEKGSIITQDNGIKTLAQVAAVSGDYHQVIFPYLMEQLKSCRPKSVPQYAESVLCAVKAENQQAFTGVLNARLGALSASQQARVRKILRQLA